MSQGWTGNPVCQGSLVEEPWEVHTDEGIVCVTDKILSSLGPPLHFLSICLCPTHFFLLQKSLPLLENQIKESYEIAVEELQKYGADIPEDDNERNFFLIDVRPHLRLPMEDSCITILQESLCLQSPKMDRNIFCP